MDCAIWFLLIRQPVLIRWKSCSFLARADGLVAASSTFKLWAGYLGDR